jgi:hypothetical protein
MKFTLPFHMICSGCSIGALQIVDVRPEADISVQLQGAGNQGTCVSPAGLSNLLFDFSIASIHVRLNHCLHMA